MNTRLSGTILSTEHHIRRNMVKPINAELQAANVLVCDAVVYAVWFGVTSIPLTWADSLHP